MIPVWPMLDRDTGLPGWVRADLRAMPELPSADQQKIPALLGRRVGAVSQPPSGHTAAHRQRLTHGSIALLAVLLAVVWWRR